MKHWHTLWQLPNKKAAKRNWNRNKNLLENIIFYWMLERYIMALSFVYFLPVEEYSVPNGFWCKFGTLCLEGFFEGFLGYWTLRELQDKVFWRGLMRNLEERTWKIFERCFSFGDCFFFIEIWGFIKFESWLKFENIFESWLESKENPMYWLKCCLISTVLKCFIVIIDRNLFKVLAGGYYA